MSLRQHDQHGNEGNFPISASVEGRVTRFRRPAFHPFRADRSARLIVLILISSWAVIVGGPASKVAACSCMAPPSVEHRVGTAEVAFVGTTVKVDRVTGDEMSGDIDRYTVDVSTVVKGDVADTVTVDVAGVGTSCEMSLGLNTEYGFVPGRRNDMLTIGFCDGTAEPAMLAAVIGKRTPLPRSTEPVAGLIVAPAGPAQIVAVDAQANIVGYVVGLTSPYQVAGCPGGAMAVVVEAVFDDERMKFTATSVDIRSLRIHKRVELPIPADFSPTRLTCADSAGSAQVFVSGESMGRASTMFVVGDDVRQISMGAVRDIVTGTDGLTYGFLDNTIVKVDSDGNLGTVADLGTDELPVASGLIDGQLVVVTGAPSVDFGTVIQTVHLVSPLADGTYSTTSSPIAHPAPLILNLFSGAISAMDPVTGETFDVALDGTVSTGALMVDAGSGSIGSARISWSWDGLVTVLVDGQPSDALDGIGPPSALTELEPTTTVDPEAPGAQALLYTATAAEILGASGTDGVGTTDPGDDEIDQHHEADDNSDTVKVVAAIAAVLALVIVAGVVIVRRRSARRVTDFPEA